MRRRATTAATLAAFLALPLLSACSGTSQNVTGVAGTPVAGSGAAEPVASASTVAGAPSCEPFAAAAASSADGSTSDTNLPCLGSGPALSIPALKGPTVVSVWASWCGPCRQELPVLQQFHAGGGSVLGVDVGDSPSSAAALIDELGITFPSVQDPGSGTRVPLGWVGPPANVVIVDGHVVYRFNRPITSVDQVRHAVTTATS